MEFVTAERGARQAKAVMVTTLLPDSRVVDCGWSGLPCRALRPRQGVDVDRGCRRPCRQAGRDRGALRAGGRAGPVGRRGQRPADHLQALVPAVRGRPTRRAALASGRPRHHGRAVHRGSRRRLPRGGRDRAVLAAAGGRVAGGPHPAGGGVRPPRCVGHHPLGGRRRRRSRLRRDAAPDVPALGRAAWLPDRGVRHVLCRGGGDQVRHLPGAGAVRVRHAVGRAGHPSPRPDLPVRQPGQAPDVLRRRRGAASDRGHRPHRHPRVRHPDRRLPVLRARAVRA